MREPTELESQQYQRLREIFATARQRYLDAGGDLHRSAGSLNGQDFLTDEEKQEISNLGRQVFVRESNPVKNSNHALLKKAM
jgi:hypothetical protein